MYVCVFVDTCAYLASAKLVEIVHMSWASQQIQFQICDIRFVGSFREISKQKIIANIQEQAPKSDISSPGKHEEN